MTNALRTPQARLRRTEANSAVKNAAELISKARIDAGPTRIAKIAERASQMPESCRRTYVAAVKGRSLAACVKAMCLECVGWQRREITNCTGLACPLWAKRPFQDS